MKLRFPDDPKYQLDMRRKVFVYKNLHRDCWSVRQDGRVKAHCNNITLRDCVFRVNERNRQKVLRERQKNVHAGVHGYICDNDHTHNELNTRAVSYDPYRFAHFFHVEDHSAIHKAKLVEFQHKQVRASNA